MKKCKSCDLEQVFSYFYKDKGSRDGLYSSCKTCSKKAWNKYNNKNKDKVNSGTKVWRSKNKEYIAKYRRDQYLKNKAVEIAGSVKYITKRRKEDYNFRLLNNLRSRLRQALKNGYKSGSAVKDLGCSIEFLKMYLESKFQEGMNWSNWALDGWHIDHVFPLSSFDLTKREELLKACHYTNLQPLWAKDNLKKSNKLEIHHGQ